MNDFLQPRPRTGEILLSAGVITESELQMALKAHTDLGLKLGETLLLYGFASRSQIESAVNETGQTASGLAGMFLPLPLLKKHEVVPLSLVNGRLVIASATTLRYEVVAEIHSAAVEAGLRVAEVVVQPTDRMDIMPRINAIAIPDYATITAEIREMERNPDDTALLSRLIDHILVDALHQRASDIHMLNQPTQSEPSYSWIAYRVDGVLENRYLAPPAVLSVVCTRIKAIANIDFSDITRPHDGRMIQPHMGRQIDVRISTIPTDHGEKVVLRLLDPENTQSVEQLFQDHPAILKEVLHLTEIEVKKGGLVLVSGATGSGKSTTMTSAIRAMDRSRIAVRTVEDPIELRVPLVDHTQVNEAAGLTYARALRAILRQDPDVIMIGELRDSETTETSLRASETGHRVLTTLHTGTVFETITRILGMLDDSFRDLGKYIVAGTLESVINQMLVKRICLNCQTEDTGGNGMRQTLLDHLDLPSDTRFFTGNGCAHCNNTGFHGRIMVPEALFIPSQAAVRRQVERVIIGKEPIRNLAEIDGVVWYSREEAVRTLLVAGKIDLRAAASVLNLRKLA